MSDPEAQREGEQDELQLDAETVKDLEPDETEADEVRGGARGSIVVCDSWVVC